MVCKRCGRVLKDPYWIEIGFGKVCWESMGNVIDKASHPKESKSSYHVVFDNQISLDDIEIALNDAACSCDIEIFVFDDQTTLFDEGGL